MTKTTAVPSSYTPTSDAPAARRDRGIYVALATLAVLLVFVGFGHSYAVRFAGTGRPLTPLVNLHAAVYVAWVLLFAAQTVLVASGRIAVHRGLGVIGVTLAAGMIVLGYITAIAAARTGYNPGGPFADAIGFLAIPMGDLVVFGAFITLAVLNRHRADVHKRLMVMALVGALVPVAITRLPGVTGNVAMIVGLSLALQLIGPISDFVTRRRIHAVYLWGVPFAFLSAPIRLAIGHSEWWRSLAAWLIA